VGVWYSRGKAQKEENTVTDHKGDSSAGHSDRNNFKKYRVLEYQLDHTNWITLARPNMKYFLEILS